MMQRPLRAYRDRHVADRRDADGDDDRRTRPPGETERAELAAFFRELGLGWEIDPEGLIDRLADPRGTR
jgi:hypothetical protein